MRMAVVNAAEGVSGITGNGTVWGFPNKSGWVYAKLCHDQDLMLQEREYRGQGSTWAR
jgi:hypothetical protein